MSAHPENSDEKDLRLMFLEAIVNSSADGVLVVDPQGKKIFQNKRTIELWKIEVDVANDPDGSRQVAHVMKMTKNPQQFFAEIEHQKKYPMDINKDQLELIDGTVLDRHSAPVVGEDGSLFGRIYHFHDVTEFRRVEDRITRLLKEKETLLREVHHRVKNYMMCLSGLLSMQAYPLKDETAIRALNDAQSRIQNMMYLYDKLYVSSGADTRSLAQYLPELVDEILTNFPKRIDLVIEKDIEDIELDPKTLQILGVITNEILTNIMKYAFGDKEEGRVSLLLKRVEGRILYTVADNGVGISVGAGTEKPSGFGLMLVNDLVRQLNGNVSIDGQDGTKVSIIFESP